MGKYFSAFPITTYANTACIDITTATHLTKEAIKSSSLYYTVDVPESMRADLVSDRSYSSSFYDWVLYYSNDIVDPYYDWRLSHETFLAYIKDKYGSLSKAIEHIDHYRVNWASDDRRISPSQYATLSSAQQKYWRPLTNEAFTYVRKEMDHKVNTNLIAKIVVADPTVFTKGAYVHQLSGSTVSFSGEVVFVGATYINVQSTDGTVDVGTLVNVDTEQSTTVAANAYSVVQYVIPLDEISYWESVNAYDYELELNDGKKTIKVMDKRYLQMIESEHQGKLANG